MAFRMAFRIPSLDEARKKQKDRQTKRKNAGALLQTAISAKTAAPGPITTPARSSYKKDKALLPCSKNVSEANSSTSSQSFLSSSTSGAKSSPTDSSVTKRTFAVHNPYAKKRSAPVKTSTSISSTNSTTVSVVEVPAQRKNNIYSTHQHVSLSSPAPQTPTPPIFLQQNASTFSQAFGPLMTEEERINQKDASSSTTGMGDEYSRAELSKQHDINLSDAAACATTTTEEFIKGSGSKQLTARDNHANLQPHVLHVSTRQRGNGLLNHIRNVPFAYSQMVPDYIMGANRCALFLSMRYHNLHPTYVHRRISELRTDFEFRLLLCLVDVEDNTSILLFLNKLCVLNDMTLMLAWTEEEAARYLETYKAFESRDASIIQRREKETFAEQAADVLTCVRSINKTDSSILLSSFGSLKGLAKAQMDELSLCPGIGEKKVRRLFDAFHKPFSTQAARKRQKREKEAAEEVAQRKMEAEKAEQQKERNEGDIHEVMV